MKHFFAFSVAVVFVTQLAMQYGLQSFSKVTDSNVDYIQKKALWVPSEEKSDTIGYAVSEDGYFVSVPQTRRTRRRQQTVVPSVPKPQTPPSVEPVVPVVPYTPGPETASRIENVLKVALAQEGNVGGEPYWSWYGFSGHVAWCACFVSWVADQNGLIEKGIIPKFAGVGAGDRWFKARKQWGGRGYVPKPGDIIFFDWNDNGSGDHVGYVVKVENGKVYTIEGNSGKAPGKCKRKEYPLNHSTILGYGIPAY